MRQAFFIIAPQSPYLSVSWEGRGIRNLSGRNGVGLAPQCNAPGIRTHGHRFKCVPVPEQAPSISKIRPWYGPGADLFAHFPQFVWDGRLSIHKIVTFLC